MEKENFEPCPFCGCKDIFIGTVAEVHGLPEVDNDGNNWNGTHYTAICNASFGHNGCGASIGWDCKTYNEAVDRWNTRAGFEFDSPAISYEERYVNDYKQKMVIEYNALKVHYNKLHKMIVKYDANTLDYEPTCPIDLLRKQKAAMGEYLNILEIRAEIENVNLEKEN